MILCSSGEPQAFCKLSSEIFDEYEVESARDAISFELDIEAFLKTLRDFEKSRAEAMYIRLQRKLANDLGSDNSTKGKILKKLATLALTYTQNFENYTAANMTHKLPISLITQERDLRLQEPDVGEVDLFLRLPLTVSVLFKRIERFRTSRLVTVCGDHEGHLSLLVAQDSLKVGLTLNEKLLVQEEGGDDPQDKKEQVCVNVKLKDWRLGGRLCEACENVVLVFCEPRMLVLHCFMDDSDDVEIMYYMAGVTV